MPYIGTSPSQGVRRVHTYTATASQTTFTGAGAEGATLSYKDSNFVDVYQNGIKLGDADYTSTSGTSIVLAQGASVNDIVVVVVFDVFSVADTVSKADGGQFDGNITMAGTLGVTGATTLSSTLGVTGAITGTTATLSTDDNNPQLTLTSTDADANVGPVMLFKRDSSSPAASDFLGYTKYSGENNADEETIYAQTFSQIVDVTNGSEDGTFAIDTMVAGTLRARVEITPTETVFNDDSADIDFRVESDGKANAFFLDGSSGNVGIGTSTALSGSSAVTALRIGNQINIYEYDDSSNPVQMNINQNIDASENYIATDHAARYQMRDGEHKWFSVGSGSSGAATNISSGERMRIDSSGNVLVATTTVVAKFTAVGSNFGISSETTAGANAGIAFFSKRTSSGIQMRFQQSSTVCGDITTNGSAVSYGSNSDYRLKENIVTEWDATTRLKQLKPSRFNFIADADTTVDGFLAHEVQSVVPEAITGVKDATQPIGNITDADGNILEENVKEPFEILDGQIWTQTGTEPVYQGIDQSKLVPLLVKTIQELEARITALENAE